MPKKQGNQYEEWLPNGNMPKKQGKKYEEWLPNGNRPKEQGKQYEEWQQAEETRKAMARVRRNNRKQWQQAVEINTSNGESPTKHQKTTHAMVRVHRNNRRSTNIGESVFECRKKAIRTSARERRTEQLRVRSNYGKMQ